MRTLVLGVALIAILAPAGTGAAQDFPSHPITRPGSPTSAR
jgi:hypothetical protein